MKQFITISILLSFLLACRETTKREAILFGIADLNAANRKLLEVAMEDGFSPPVASRVYVYPHIAHFVALHAFYPDSLPKLIDFLNRPKVTRELSTAGAHPHLTALLAFCKTARKVVFSEHYFTEYIKGLEDKARSAGIPTSEITASGKCSDTIAQHMFNWIGQDRYAETRTMDRFTSSKKPAEWRETPPDYIASLEPHWMKIKTLLIDSAGIYPASPPPPYDPTKNSAFYNMVLEVYNESKGLDSAKKAIAWFWDDNPNVSEHRGHLVTMTHKISPPGHWLNIIDQISTRENSSLFKTTKAYTFTAIAMYDGIISCWYEKYKRNLVRPISFIQEYIDVNWRPLIQTPPFPEYTSGHSVLSAAAATVLTALYGDNYAFSDSTATLFGQPVRYFKSFKEAAWEVSLSRFYAGIHYMPGVTEGNKQGSFIGNTVLRKLN